MLPSRTRSLAGRLALLLAIVLGGPVVRAQQHDTTPATAGGEAAAPAPGHDEAAADHGAVPNILEVQPPLAFWTLIVFAVLFFVLWKFAWGPLSHALSERERFMEDSLQKAEIARAEGERLLAEHRKLMDAASVQAQTILDDARRGAQVAAEEVRKTAQREADAILDRARREINTARDQAMIELWSKSADLAVSIAGRVLDRELSPDDHRRLIEQAMAELPAAPAPNGRRG